MSLLDWMSLNLLVDISFVVFATAVTWKLIKTKKEISKIRSMLEANILNPQKARRALKKENK